MLRTARELMSVSDPAWPLITEWTGKAGSHVEVLPVFLEQGAQELVSLQVTARSVMGGLALHCGGLLVQHGWMRILGCGHARCEFSLTNLTRALGWARENTPPVAVAVGIDVLGGVFAVNGGLLGDDSLGQVHYFDPSVLRWTALELGHAEWVHAMLQSPLVDAFYQDLRWPGWQAECASLPANSGFSIFPFLWSKESRPIESTSRRSVPLAELIHMGFDLARQLDAGNEI